MDQQDPTGLAAEWTTRRSEAPSDGGFCRNLGFGSSVNDRFSVKIQSSCQAQHQTSASANCTGIDMATKKGGKSKKKVEVVFPVCEETGDYNYTLRRKSGGEKLKLKKYSPRLRTHTMHIEKKK